MPSCKKRNEKKKCKISRCSLFLASFANFSITICSFFPRTESLCIRQYAIKTSFHILFSLHFTINEKWRCAKFRWKKVFFDFFFLRALWCEHCSMIWQKFTYVAVKSYAKPCIINKRKMNSKFLLVFFCCAHVSLASISFLNQVIDENWRRKEQQKLFLSMPIDRSLTKLCNIILPMICTFAQFCSIKIISKEFVIFVVSCRLTLTST